jgi:predicted transcriptional regulator
MGALLGTVIIYWFPASGINIPLAVLAGMSALFAGASRAYLTSIIFALETTGQTNALLPLLATCTAAYFVSYFMMENTIMTEKIARKGIKTPHSYQPDALEKVTVAQALTDKGMILSEKNTVKEVREWLNEQEEYHSNYFIISSDKGEYRGILSSSNLLSNHHSQDKQIGTLIKRNNIYISLNESLRTALETMAKENIDVLPVISGENNNVIGVLSYHDIIAIYKYDIDEHVKKQPNISLKRNGLKILLRGQKIVSAIKRKNK